MVAAGIGGKEDEKTHYRFIKQQTLLINESNVDRKSLLFH
nr:MAG TPA: hypothetical protein [Caudoviricetes sp.]